MAPDELMLSGLRPPGARRPGRPREHDMRTIVRMRTLSGNPGDSGPQRGDDRFDGVECGLFVARAVDREPTDRKLDRPGPASAGPPASLLLLLRRMPDLFPVSRYLLGRVPKCGALQCGHFKSTQCAQKCARAPRQDKYVVSWLNLVTLHYPSSIRKQVE